LRDLIERIAELSESWKSIPFPARTHGQPASPTTAGKEMAVFLGRLVRQARQLEAHRFRGKLNGATGTHAALAVAAPTVDWPAFSRAFVEGMGLEWSGCTTQIEGHDAIAEYLMLVARVNTIVLDLDQDLWQYISHGEIVQKPVTGEVGSSTMPHKVNPIHFENSEGNVVISNALLHALSDKLPQSRMQRDLSGSTALRNVGVALSHGYLAIGQTLQGLARIDVDRETARQHIDAHPEVLAEAIQTILRTEGVENPYDLLKSLTRGQTLTLDELRQWIDGLVVSEKVKTHLRSLRPAQYIGLAISICDAVVEDARTWLSRSRSHA
jgi:adenylosuccinate lyase